MCEWKIEMNERKKEREREKEKERKSKQIVGKL